MNKNQKVRELILSNIDKEHSTYAISVELIDNFLNTVAPYESKQERIDEVGVPTDAIVEAIFVSLLPLKVVTPIQTVIGQVASVFSYWDRLDDFKMAADCIAELGDIGLFELVDQYDYDNNEKTIGIKSFFALDEDVQEEVDSILYTPPAFKPFQYDKNGYINGTYCTPKAFARRDVEQNIHYLNTIQKVKYKLNKDMLRFKEVANKVLTDGKSQKQFAKHVEETKAICKDYKDAGFYFKWKYDSRGRSYPNGYHINGQGSEYKKAMLNFAHEEKLTGI